MGSDPSTGRPVERGRAFLSDEQREISLMASQPERIDDVHARAVDQLAYSLASDL